MKKVKTLMAYGIAGLVIFLLARTVGWYAQRTPIVQLQRQIRERVEELNGYAYYDFQIIDPGLPSERIADLDDPELARHWLSPWLGADYFHDLVYVTFAQFDGVPEDGGQAAPRSEIGHAQILPLLQLPTISWWALSGTAITDQTVTAIAEQVKPQRLWLGQTQITDQSLEALAACPSLEYLAIEATPTTDRGLQSVATLTNLKTLSLGSPFYTAAGIRALASLPRIEELRADRLPVAGALESFAALTTLRVLSLRATGIGDKDLVHLAGLTELQVLHLDSNLIGDAGLAVAKNWQDLKELTLRGTLVTDQGLSSLLPCSGLERLELADTECTLAGVVGLFVAGQGRTLQEALPVVFDCQQNEAGELISLDLSDLEIGDGDVALLAPLHNLEWLRTPDSKLTHAGVEQLSKLPFDHLELLDLNGAQVDGEGLQHLLRFQSLRDLHVAGTQVTEDDVQLVLQTRPTLRIYRKQIGRR